MAKAATQEPAVEEEGGLRSQMFKHEAQVEWINETEGINLDELSAAEIIAWAYATRVAWRKTDTYRNLVEEYRSSAAEEAEAKKAATAAAKAAREAEKAAAAAKATPAPVKATKAAAKKAPAAKATPAPRKATRAKKGAAASDNPFD